MLSRRTARAGLATVPLALAHPHETLKDEQHGHVGIVSVLAEDPVIETAPADKLNLRVFGPDTVVVTGRSPILNRAETVPTTSAGWRSMSAPRATGGSPQARRRGCRSRPERPTVPALAGNPEKARAPR